MWDSRICLHVQVHVEYTFLYELKQTNTSVHFDIYERWKHWNVCISYVGTLRFWLRCCLHPMANIRKCYRFRSRRHIQKCSRVAFFVYIEIIIITNNNVYVIDTMYFVCMYIIFFLNSVSNWIMCVFTVYYLAQLCVLFIF